MSLRERIEAEIARKQAIAESVPPLPANNWRRAATAFAHWTDEASRAIERHIALWSPASVLAALAEDRDILKRHAPIQVDHFPGQHPICAYEWADGDAYVVSWELCPEIQSLARRHGVTP